MNNTICEAIASKNIVEFYYNGGIRIAEPHCYGIHKNTGNEVLCAYQIRGFSESGNLPGWRLFDVADVSALKITGEQFLSPRPNYNPNDKRMSKIFCNI
ncbi:MAG: hypothetical protein IBX72_12310 [Nitrospirae bacterium]|nr:hypothetical protein [Nitrospirota bacterium]